MKKETFGTAESDAGHCYIIDNERHIPCSQPQLILAKILLSILEKLEEKK